MVKQYLKYQSMQVYRQAGFLSKLAVSGNFRIHSVTRNVISHVRIYGIYVTRIPDNMANE